MLTDKLTKLVAKTDLSITAEQIEQLVAYVNLLDKWNKAYNLTSVRDPNEMIIKHIMDSIVVSPYLREVTNIGNNFIDVGTGPGLTWYSICLLLIQI